MLDIFFLFQMDTLFEEFVRTFYRKEQSQYRVSSPQIHWAMDEATSTANGIRLLPSMETDIVLESLGDRIIIDCKFYRDAFQRRFDTKKFISGHLYQIFVYLKNQELRPGWESARGILFTLLEANRSANK